MADKTVPLSDEPQSPDFEAELPLPIEDRPKPVELTPEPGQDTSLDLIRKKLDQTYATEPDVVAEEKIAEVEPEQSSKHQKFLKDLADSGKSVAEMQLAWHEYYSALSDQDKQAVWQEFEAGHKARSSYNKERELVKAEVPHPTAFKPRVVAAAKLRRVFEEAKHQARQTATGAKQLSPKQGLRSLAFGLSVGGVAIVILLFSFFNERFIAPLIQPSRTALSASIITSGNVSNSPELIIPKINLEVPVVYGVTGTDTKSVQTALESGVLHYADTAQPGQDGNLVIVGHSSNNILNPGKYKFAFVLLHDLQTGDTFYLQKNGVRYVYQIYKREIVSPTDTSVLGSQGQTATASLITCDPPGTSTNRLVVIGKQISPSVANNKPASGNNSAAVEAPIIPGNSPSLWSRLYSWLTH